MLVGNRKTIITWLLEQDDEKQFSVKEFRQKRSLDANSYYWALLSDLKDALRTSTQELHEQLLQRYSVPVEKDGRPVTVTLKEDIPISLLPGYWLPIKKSNGWAAYMLIKGSSDMDTKEFSALLDGLISECKEVGIETMTPQEIEKLRNYEKQVHKSL